jgi:hypothetical protein
VTTGEPVSDVLPKFLDAALKAIGVVPLEPDEPEPKVERDFTFKMPTLDENGEPDW